MSWSILLERINCYFEKKSLNRIRLLTDRNGIVVRTDIFFSLLDLYLSTFNNQEMHEFYETILGHNPNGQSYVKHQHKVRQYMIINIVKKAIPYRL